MEKLKFFRIFLVLVLSAINTLAIADTHISWGNWVKQLRQEALSEGIRPDLLDHIFFHMKPSTQHIQLDRNQPEKRISYQQYRNTRGDAYRIKIGQKEFQKHHQLLQQIGQDLGVDPCVITALWGLESSYGRVMGNFNVIQSLATLSFDHRRSNFFRKQLLLALHMVNDGIIPYEDFKGEWAGASGQTQFLPSSWYLYAVDYDHNGKKDIWNSYPDIFASIANYLKQNGWIYKQLILVPVDLASTFDQHLIGLDTVKTVQEWLNLGVRPNTNHYIAQKAPASIVAPDGGPTWMVLNNFNTLMKWNHSIYYAGTVAFVAQKICSVNSSSRAK